MSYEQDVWKTRWDLLQDLQERSSSTKREILERLVSQYWRPIFWYIRRKGYSEHRAEELTQEFFYEILKKELFAKADAREGKFRSYLLGALTNFLNKAYRNANTQRRKPSSELISIDAREAGALVDCDRFNTPEKAFHHVWAAELLEQALEECRYYFEFSSDTTKQKYWGVFHDRVLLPILEESPSLSLEKISEKYGIPKQYLSNIVVTVKRRMRRAITNTIARYCSPGVNMVEELEDLMQSLK